MLDPLMLAREHLTSSSFETAVLTELGRKVGFDVGFFSVRGDERRPSVAGLEPAIIARAIAGAEHLRVELGPVKRRALSGDGVAVDSEVLGAHMRKTRYYRELVAPIGGRHSLLGYLRLRGEVVGMVMLGRCGGGFAHGELERVAALLPDLALARASYGLPPLVEPPRALAPALPRARGLLSRLGLGARERLVGTAPLARGEVVVRDRDGYREMVAREGEAEMIWTRAALEDAGVSGWPYVELLHLGAIVARERTSALFLGLGGGVILRQFARTYPGIAIDVVEREPSVVELARAHYALEAIPSVTLHLGDGLEHLRRASARWDVIVVDAYDAADLASGLETRAGAAALARALEPGGAVAVNVIGRLAGPGPLRSVVHALSAELDDVRIVPVVTATESFDSEARRNVIVVARKRP